MFTILVISMLLWTYGVFFIVYAYREPPTQVASLFRVRVPLLFGLLLALVPEEHTVKFGRIGIGAFLIVGSLAFAFEAFHQIIRGWI